MNQLKVLFIASSNDRIGDTIHRTGVWLEELAAPYYVFKDSGAFIAIASPEGGAVTLDPKSESIIVATRYSNRFLKDKEAMNFLLHSTKLDDIKAADFDLVYLPGGHAALWDFTDNRWLKQLLETFNLQNKPIGLTGHGTAALLALQNDNGEPLVKDKQVTGPSNAEEKSGSWAQALPYFLENELTSLGALYSKNENYVNWVIADGNIITGQNPASSEEVARKMLLVLENSKHSLPSTPAVSH